MLKEQTLKLSLLVKNYLAVYYTHEHCQQLDKNENVVQDALTAAKKELLEEMHKIELRIEEAEKELAECLKKS